MRSTAALKSRSTVPANNFLSTSFDRSSVTLTLCKLNGLCATVGVKKHHKQFLVKEAQRKQTLVCQSKKIK